MSSPDHAPGAPWGDEASERLLPVYCVHEIRWEPTQAGYVPQTIDADHPDLPCRDVGAIPPTCQPVIGYDPNDPK